MVEPLGKPHDDPLIRRLTQVINYAVRVMAVLMTVVILYGVVDIIWIIYERLMSEPRMILKINDFFVIFGAFMVVLIAIEIFVNITVYLRDDVIHVNIVMATALMAVARKVITLDYSETTPEFVYGTAALVIAMSVGYWIVVIRERHSHLMSGIGQDPGQAKK